MLLNLRQIGTGVPYDEKTLEFTHSLDLSGIRLWGGHPFLKPVAVSGLVICRSGIYTIRYTAGFELSGECSRCLIPIKRAITREFEHTVLVGAANEDNADEFIRAQDEELDLDELVISDLLLEFNDVLLCDENCRGLCLKCGMNLNDGVCSCDLREPDSRFDVLRKLLEEK